MVGNGFQRSLMLAAFSAYAKHIQNSKETPTFRRKQIFAIEEPELYLHPHLQRRLYDILKPISDKDQVVLSTHSPNLIRLEDYQSIYLVRKGAPGTFVNFWKKKEGIPNAREQFLYVTKVRSSNEIFFAKKVILVEGEVELVSLPVLLEKRDASLDEKGITIANCQGKTNIPLFEKVLNAFEIPYIAVYDKDTETENDDELNEEIRTLATENNASKPFVFNPNFEKVLGMTKSQKSKVGKPQACYDLATKMKPDNIPKEIERLLNLITS